MYDGRNIHVYKPDINNKNTLSSNVIRSINETDNQYLWAITKSGLNKLSKRNNEIGNFWSNVKDDSYLEKDKNGNLFLLYKKGVISWYNRLKDEFIDLPINNETVCENVNRFIIDSNDTIWMLHKGILEKYTITFPTNDDPHIERQADFKHPYPIDCIFYSQEQIIFTDEKGQLFIIDSQGKKFIRNISHLTEENGSLSSGIFDDADILIGFKSNGLYRLHAQKDYEITQIDINCGVFCLLKDEEQDIIWVGTDGQGVYALTQDEYSFRSLNLVELPIHKKRPVRAIQTDHRGNLWLGTKENGVIRISDYNINKDYSSGKITHFTTSEGLSNNAVFALEMSKAHNILWIGSDGDELNYYSFDDNKMHKLINEKEYKPAFVHTMFEANDTLLWVGAGNHLLKISIQKQGKGFEAKDIKQYDLDIRNKQRFNQIYALVPENDSIIWVGIRGNGVVRFNSVTEKHELITFDRRGIPPMNDILSLHLDKNKTIWVGSSYGITKLTMTPDGDYTFTNYNEDDGLPNNTIHGILEDEEGKLWLSSNTGIILFNTHKETFQSFGQRTGLKTIEFSDNAYFKHKPEETFFFGGIDGVVWIKKEEHNKNTFVPKVHFMRLRIFNTNYNIHDFEKRKDNERYIELSHKQNFFAISFAAMDFINGENSLYSYKLDNFSNVWMDTRQNEANFTNIPPGSYTLNVKYNDGTNENESQIQKLKIVILPPWYMTMYARIIYALMAAAFIYFVYYYIRMKYEKRKRKIARQLQEKYKEEMYEGKLRFFTNITHEFSTPLTLIYGPCQRILTYKYSDSFIHKYAQIIKANTERLNTLIQEVIDFRRMETGNRICHIQELDISKMASDITESFSELTEQNKIGFETDIDPGITWNSDNGCFTKILINLISNAFKYTPENGRIHVSVKTNNDKLILKVYNTGKGIAKENIPLIFNRYSVLDNIEENAIKGLSSRNGLGLAICHSMTELLKGTIEVESEVNEYAQFIVTLPLLRADHTDGINADRPLDLNAGIPSTENISAGFSESHSFASEEMEDIDRSKPHILIIDDNKELLWMLDEILSGEYKISTAEDGEIGMELLKTEIPDVIITDIMMPKMDGITLIRHMKENKHTMHIPLVILSAKNANDEKIEGLESGADVYISKPFNCEYLKAVLRQLIKNKKNLELYYNSSASAFEFVNGQLLQKEDKDFLQMATEVIAENIDNTEFTPNELARTLQTSVRNLYRKFKELNQLPPNDFIKEQRIHYAAKLLVTTTQTVQEVMYKSGFANRAHFYKEFDKRYKQTPKEYREAYKSKDER
jgi:signal transduction histidine kinase/DNA-binding response OmpR family regulator/ligand-binding sensor domain-containing protein